MQRFIETSTYFAVVMSMALIGNQALAKKPDNPDGGGEGKPPTYTVVRLDDDDGRYDGVAGDGAEDINDNGHVVGGVKDTASGNSVAAFWWVEGTDSMIVPLPQGATAFGLNERNEIVGLGYLRGEDEHPLAAGHYWSGPFDEAVPLPPLWEGFATVAYAINDSGVICGYAREPLFDEEGQDVGQTNVAVLWRVTNQDGEPFVFGPVALPTFNDWSVANDVNACDAHGFAEVVGRVQGLTSPERAAVQWTVLAHADGTLTVDPDAEILHLAIQASAEGVNNVGVICGLATQDGPNLAHIWIDGEGQALNSNRVVRAVAWDINDAGAVVGAADLDMDAIVWPSADEAPIRLSNFLPRRDPPFSMLTEATAINNAGTVVGVGDSESGRYAFLAVPK